MMIAGNDTLGLLKHGYRVFKKWGNFSGNIGSVFLFFFLFLGSIKKLDFYYYRIS
jgi:hypothetical protein